MNGYVKKREKKWVPLQCFQIHQLGPTWMVTICENLITFSFESCDLLGTIHKQRRQFLRIYDCPLPQRWWQRKSLSWFRSSYKTDSSLGLSFNTGHKSVQSLKFNPKLARSRAKTNLKYHFTVKKLTSSRKYPHIGYLR